MTPISGPLSQQKVYELREAAQEFMRAEGLSQADLGKLAGHSATYISNAINGTGGLPETTVHQVLRDINNAVDRYARAKENRDSFRCHMTAVVRTLLAAGNEARERAMLLEADGPAGIGKTVGAQHVAATLGAAYLYIDPDNASPSRFLRALYNASSRKPLARRVSLDEVVEKLRMPERLATCNLVIVDQGHELQDKTLRIVMAVHDRARCSFMLLGTVDIRRRVDADNDVLFGQLSSRVGLRIDLGKGLTGYGGEPGGRDAAPLFTADDVRAIFEAGRLKLHPDTLRMLVAIANTPGKSLRVAALLHFYAERLATRKAAGMVLPVHVEAAATHCRVTIPTLKPAAQATRAAV